ncbi:MAG: phosphotransferase [Streptosporangiaceae bacterium]
MTERQLSGGVANTGSVTQAGDHVLRPASSHWPSIHKLLLAVRAAGFEGASRPVGVEPDGRERLEFIDGDVAVPPYPSWAQADSALASVAWLLRQFHHGSASLDQSGTTWSAELADPSGHRTVVCHNDVCLENVVFRDGVAVGLLDFDYAAPGRPEYDLARFAGMCVPVDDDLSAGRLGWHQADRPARLRLVADAYGLDTTGRQLLLEITAGLIARGGEFVRRHVQAGDPGFITMWTEMGGAQRFDRRREWWEESRWRFAAALT